MSLSKAGQAVAAFSIRTVFWLFVVAIIGVPLLVIVVLMVLE